MSTMLSIIISDSPFNVCNFILMMPPFIFVFIVYVFSFLLLSQARVSNIIDLEVLALSSSILYFSQFYWLLLTWCFCYLKMSFFSSLVELVSPVQLLDDLKLLFLIWYKFQWYKFPPWTVLAASQTFWFFSIQKVFF